MAKTTSAGSRGLVVAVTGPTGSIGLPFLKALDQAPEVARVIGMARSPFEPESLGLTKVEYRRGDILDQTALDRLVTGADVVVHLAFLIFGSIKKSREVNLEGSKMVFAAAFDAKVKRLVYTSSVAAYGFHEDNPDLLDETMPARGSDAHYYSAQKAELEKLLTEAGRGHATQTYILRPCVVAGPTALELIEKIPFVKTGALVPKAVRKLVGSLPVLRPVLPDPGVPFQLVHQDDVAQALMRATLGKGEPGIYNLAAEGEVSITDLAHALGWYAIPVPDIALDATAQIISRLPLMPVEATWVDALRFPVLVRSDKAREVLGWEPRYDAFETLSETVHAARAEGLVVSRPGSA